MAVKSEAEFEVLLNGDLASPELSFEEMIQVLIEDRKRQARYEQVFALHIKAFASWEYVWARLMPSNKRPVQVLKRRRHMTNGG